MSRYPLEYQRHILDETGCVEGIVCGLEEAEFLVDETLKRPFVRSLVIIGGAEKKIPSDFKDRYPGIEWKKRPA